MTKVLGEAPMTEGWRVCGLYDQERTEAKQGSSAGAQGESDQQSDGCEGKGG